MRDRLKCFVFVIGLWFGLISLPVFASSMPAIQTWTTASGVPVYFVKRTDLPMLDIAIVFDAGSAQDGSSFGLCALTAQSLDQGAGLLSSDQIADRWAELGAQYQVTITRDMTQIKLRSLTRPDVLPSVLSLLHQVVLQPTFTQPSILHQKQQLLTALQYQQQNPAETASLAFYHALYGSYPYAHNPLGTKKSLTALTPTDVKHFYQQYYVTSNAKIIMVGDLTKRQAKKASNALLQGLPKGQATPSLQPPPVISHPVEQTIDYPSEQASVVLGQLGITRKNPDYFALMVGNHILGGIPLDSILFNSVRNQQGLAYSVGSTFVSLQQPGPFFIMLQTQAEKSKQAIALTKQSLQTFISDKVSSSQLQLAQANMLGSFVTALSSNANLLDIVAYIAFYNRALDYLETYQTNIQAVTAVDIHKSFNRLINMKKLIVVTVGPEKQHAN